MPTFINVYRLDAIETALENGYREFNYGACHGISVDAYYKLVLIFSAYVNDGEKIREVNVNKKLKEIINRFRYDDGIE